MNLTWWARVINSPCMLIQTNPLTIFFFLLRWQYTSFTPLQTLTCFIFSCFDSGPYQHLGWSQSIKFTLAKGQIYWCHKREQPLWLYWLFLSLTWGKEPQDEAFRCFYSESLSIPVLVSLSAIALIRIITCFRGVSVVFYYALYISAKWTAYVYVFNK